MGPTKGLFTCYERKQLIVLLPSSLKAKVLLDSAWEQKLAHWVSTLKKPLPTTIHANFVYMMVELFKRNVGNPEKIQEIRSIIKQIHRLYHTNKVREAENLFVTWLTIAKKEPLCKPQSLVLR